MSIASLILRAKDLWSYISYKLAINKRSKTGDGFKKRERVLSIIISTGENCSQEDRDQKCFQVRGEICVNFRRLCVPQRQNIWRASEE